MTGSTSNLLGVPRYDGVLVNLEELTGDELNALLRRVLKSLRKSELKDQRDQHQRDVASALYDKWDAYDEEELEKDIRDFRTSLIPDETVSPADDLDVRLKGFLAATGSPSDGKDHTRARFIEGSKAKNRKVIAGGLAQRRRAGRDNECESSPGRVWTARSGVCGAYPDYAQWLVIVPERERMRILRERAGK